MDLYFSRHDGSAVTCDDFRAAMADANGADLAQFERWYTQAGTPTVSVDKVRLARAVRSGVMEARRDRDG
jgi:aminopeptidase N